MHVRAAGVLGLLALPLFAPFAARAQESAAPRAAAAGSASPPPARASRARAPANTIEAGPPQFETLADGTTRFSVALSQAQTCDAKAGPGRIAYVIKGARALHRNDYNPLVTVDFNTPVTSARLTPHGRDLWFVVDLRAPVKPEVKTDSAQDGGMVLQIEFPKGDYLAKSAGADPEVAPSSSGATPAEPAPSSAPVAGRPKHAGAHGRKPAQ